MNQNSVRRSWWMTALAVLVIAGLALDTHWAVAQATATATFTPSRTPTITLTPSLTPTRTPTATPTRMTYVVREGDQLLKIARRFGVTLSALMAANGLKSDTIFPGQVLIIPAPFPTATLVPAVRKATSWLRPASFCHNCKPTESGTMPKRAASAGNSPSACIGLPVL